MRRIAVVGSGGAGKSTLARALGRRLGLPVVHLDEHYWQPGWRPADPDAWRARQARLVRREAWILDGNYLSTLDLRLGAADTVVFVDLPRWRCAWRATRRVVAGRGQANTAPGCPERLDLRHLRFLGYVWRFPRRTRPRVLRDLARHAGTTTVIRLSSPSQVRRFLGEPRPRGGWGARPADGGVK